MVPPYFSFPEAKMEAVTDRHLRGYNQGRGQNERKEAEDSKICPVSLLPVCSFFFSSIPTLYPFLLALFLPRAEGVTGRVGSLESHLSFSNRERDFSSSFFFFGPSFLLHLFFFSPPSPSQGQGKARQAHAFKRHEDLSRKVHGTVYPPPPTGVKPWRDMCTSKTKERKMPHTGVPASAAPP